MQPDEFPIVEAFGFRWDAKTPDALEGAAAKFCPFSNEPCEKYRQYRFGYCSVRYAAADDGGVAHTYAVCDHRLDGGPLQFTVADHFAAVPVAVVPEIVLTQPRTSFDYVAFEKGNVENIIAIETQSIDIRGGGVGPAWRAWEDGKVSRWRDYFTAEAREKGRQDKVAYGVNMANIYKRLGLQVAVKGAFLRAIQIPLYVLMQDRPFQYLRSRVRFDESGDDWDISFVTFDYDQSTTALGQMSLRHCRTVRTTVAKYADALLMDRTVDGEARKAFLERVQRKARLQKVGPSRKGIG